MLSGAAAYAEPPVASNVQIAGTPEVGFTLTGSYDYSDPEGDPEGVSTFRWLRDGSAIAGATGISYDLVTADEGSRIVFEVTPVAQSGISPGSPAQSPQTEPIRPANTAPVASNVSISGIFEVDQTLTGEYDYFDADGDPEGASQYRWLRLPFVFGACQFGFSSVVSTAPQYTPTAGDVGACFVFEVRPVAASGTETVGTPVQSPVSPRITQNQPPVATGVSITGTPEVGFTLTGSYTYSDVDGDAEGASTYRWLRDGVPIAGATGTSYDLVVADAGSRIVFEVTPVAQSGASPGSPAQSPQTEPIRPANTPPTASNVQISGTPEAGFPLTGSYDYADADGDAEGNSTYRWLRNGSPIGGATDTQYLLTAADVGASIVFEVTPAAASGVSPGSAAQSAPVGPIRPANTPPVASNVQISGTPEAGFTLTGSYDYDDADGDAEGSSTYRWLRNGAPIAGATSIAYLLTAADVDANIVFEVTPVAASGVSPGEPAQSPPVGPIRPANTAPFATDVSISGVALLGETLTGIYTYNDADGDLEGETRFRWYRDGNRIGGADEIQYTVVGADIGREIQFEVTPEAQTGVSPGDPVLSPPLGVVNQPPVINGQNPLATDEDTPLTLTLDDFDVSDPDTDPDDLTLIVQDGANYTRQGTTVTPAQDFNGTLTVPVQVSDGVNTSEVFNASVTVNPINDAPRISGQVPDPIITPEDTSVAISLANNLQIDDPDNTFPADFTLTLGDGDNYTVAGFIVTPDENFNGRLRVPAIVTDTAGAASAPFDIQIDVSAENDAPLLVAAIEDTTAIEDSLFELDVSGNFDDPDRDPLTFAATWSEAQPPNIAFDPATGVFSGTPRFEDTEAPGPVYDVTVTASDPSGAFVSASFVLTISALDRANLALDIAVTPATGQPGDEFVWTFTSTNPVGPQPGATVELTGTFTGSAITATADGAAVCTFDAAAANATDFNCTIGDLPVGATSAINLRTTVNAVTEVLVTATTASANSLPIDPNLDDNSESRAIGIGDAFSIGAAQSVGSSSAMSVASGDVNGDGRPDIVIGTAAGQSVEVFLADAPRESCNCYRDFAASPISTASTGETTGIAMADFDNNGTLDMALATGGGQPDEVYGNDGSGNFTLMATLDATFGRGIAVGDFNNDGNADLVVAALGANPVYLGDGTGSFVRETTLGDDDSHGVAVARISTDNLDDVVFANDGGNSRYWRRRSGGGFTSAATFSLGDTRAVAAGDLNGDGAPDLVFARVAAPGNGVPSNPIYLNDGSGGFGSAAESLTISPTVDVEIGDINGDGVPDLLFVSAAGVHQVWLANGASYTLAAEQIIDLGAVAATIGDFGEIAESDPGGSDIVLAGAPAAGVGIYLNDGAGNLGRGDAVPPELTLNGEATLSIPAGSNYVDDGATAIDNIDGDISRAIIVDSNVNTAVVGSYTVTYNVSDFAGNSAASVSRSVSVAPATGAGGGGGGGLSAIGLAALTIMLTLGWLSGGVGRQFEPRRFNVSNRDRKKRQ